MQISASTSRGFFCVKTSEANPSTDLLVEIIQCVFPKGSHREQPCCHGEQPCCHGEQSCCHPEQSCCHPEPVEGRSVEYDEHKA